MLTRVSRISSICSKRQLWGQRLWSYTTRWTFWYFFEYFVRAYKKVQLNQFFVNSFAYYGLTMNIGDLAADNVYLNFAVSGGFQEKCILTKKQLIERYRTSRDPKLWLGRSYLAVRRAQNSVFRVCVDIWTTLKTIGTLTRIVKEMKWIDFPGRCSSVESHCSPFPWCRKANLLSSLSLHSLVRSGLPIEKVF